MRTLCAFGIVFSLMTLLGCNALETARQNWVPQRYATLKMVYLAPDTLAAGEDIPGGSLALSLRGVHIVHNMTALKQWTVQESPQVIMVHQASLAELDSKWLAEQYDAGVTITSFNLTMHELYKLLGTSLPASSGFTDGWQRKPFYSYTFKTVNNGFGNGSGNYNLGPETADLDSLLSVLELTRQK